MSWYDVYAAMDPVLALAAWLPIAGVTLALLMGPYEDLNPAPASHSHTNSSN
jgi:hypothetical protein